MILRFLFSVFVQVWRSYFLPKSRRRRRWRGRRRRGRRLRRGLARW